MGWGTFIAGRMLRKRPSKHPPEYYQATADQMNEWVNNGLNKLGVIEFLNNQNEKDKIAREILQRPPIEEIQIENSTRNIILGFLMFILMTFVIYLLLS